MNHLDERKQYFGKYGMVIPYYSSLMAEMYPSSMHLKLMEWEVCAQKYELVLKFKLEFDEKKMERYRLIDETMTLELYLAADLVPGYTNLVKLFAAMLERRDEPAFLCCGDVVDNRFLVSFLEPVDMSRFPASSYFLFLKEMDVHMQIPLFHRRDIDTTLRKDNAYYFYRAFSERYPDSIGRSIEKLLELGMIDDVHRLVTIEWRPQPLQLPTAKEARRMLDRTVYGMETVKQQLLILLEKVRRSGSLEKNILLVGPPGVGKTTILHAISKVFGNIPVSEVAMASCRDSETLTGFAKCYMNSHMGSLTSALLHPVRTYEDGRTEVCHQIQQIVYFNELDKSPSNAIQPMLLRMLDGNRSFYDTYYELDFPLSNVMIVADANDKHMMSEPLLDRFFVIDVPGYTTEEKQEIFRRFTFPQMRKAEKVDSCEVSVTQEAVRQIAASCKKPGVRELQDIADQIIGDYLLHYADRKSTVHYTPKMVEKFLPKTLQQRNYLQERPGSVCAAITVETVVSMVAVQAVVKPSFGEEIRLLGTDDSLLRQELEASARCACGLLPNDFYDVTVQLYGLPAQTPVSEQLGLAVFMAVLSAFYEKVVSALFYGSVTLLGSITAKACTNSDELVSLAEAYGKALYTACGFSDRLTQERNKLRVVEVLSAEALHSLLYSGLLGQRAG